MELKTNISKRSFQTPLICHICGDTARGLNFEVMTCMSCKAFFRRHALRTNRMLHCLLDNHCSITKQTRGGCSACRLQKCFSLGMNPKLIRSSNQKKIKSSNKSIFSQPQPLSLLNNDRSMLTLDEWNLLSNIIHAYDEQNLIIRTQHCFKEQASLPPKIRSKQINTLELIGSYYTAMQPFIERSPYFYTLPSDIRYIIVQNNMNGTGALNSMLAAAEADVYDNETHITVCNEIYGVDYVEESHRLLKKIEMNRTLIKMMLMILAFSSNCSIVSYDHPIYFVNTSTFSSFHLLRIQNIFITMFWKYLVYQYGYIEAIRRCMFLVKNYLDVLKRIEENHSQKHHQMVDDIVQRTSYSLTLND